MFYIGDILWITESENKEDIPGFQNFSGHIHYCFKQGKWFDIWIDKGKFQSFKDPMTGELMPAIIHSNGIKLWYDKGQEILCPIFRK